MSLFGQIFFGSIVLDLYAFIHIVLLAVAIRLLKITGSRFGTQLHDSQWGILIAIALTIIILAHTVEVWIWATTFVMMGALPNYNDAVYFSIVTYTTLGYGDVTISNNFRTFASMAAVTGLLNFGLSTALLVGIFSRWLTQKME